MGVGGEADGRGGGEGGGGAERGVLVGGWGGCDGVSVRSGDGIVVHYGVW